MSDIQDGSCREGERSLSPPAAQADTAPRPLERPGHVLVVDDDPLILSAFRRVLRHEAEVVALQDAREALARLRAGETFDVVFCDLFMPEMTGIELHAALMAWRPEVARAVVFITGGAFTPGARRFLDEVPNTRFTKPFDTAQVRQLVRSRRSAA